MGLHLVSYGHFLPYPCLIELVLYRAQLSADRLHQSRVLMTEHVFRLEAYCSGINIVVLALGSYSVPQLPAAVDT